MGIKPSMISMLLRGIFGVAAGMFFLMRLLRAGRFPASIYGACLLAGIALTLCGILCLTLYFLRRR